MYWKILSTPTLTFLLNFLEKKEHTAKSIFNSTYSGTYTQAQTYIYIYIYIPKQNAQLN